MANARSILVLNGPNLNKLGERETSIYGTLSLKDIESLCHETAKPLQLSVDFRQSNHEGELVEWIQQSDHAGMAINAAAYTHTSIAIHDALRLFKRPIIEVHLSNIYQREEFRHTSYVSPIADGVICGLGATGYQLALQALAEKLG